jgi:soluble lytic murein transglycosylase-like protein
MQLIPDTSARFNVKKPFDPEQNLRGGLAYLRWLLAYFEGDVSLVAAAYNAGEGRRQSLPRRAALRRDTGLRQTDHRHLQARRPSLRRQGDDAFAGVAAHPLDEGSLG